MEELNKEIALMMGWSVGTHPEFKGWFYGISPKGKYYNGVCDQNYDLAFEKMLKKSNYFKEWNDLMQVVDFIESLTSEFHGKFAVYIHGNSCTIQGTRLDTRPETFHPAYFSQIYADTKKLAVFEAVGLFAKLYNQNNKQIPIPTIN
jgi:hypothetical protein